MSSVTLTSLFSTALSRFGSRPAVNDGGTILSYQELVSTANKLAHRLISLGVGPGSTVALMMSNRLEYVIADQAIIRCGAVKVALNDMLAYNDINYILRDSEVSVAIADSGMLADALLCRPDCLRAIIAVSEADHGEAVMSWKEALTGQPDSTPDIEPDSSDLGLIIYTGGTTGRSKGVMHSYHSLAVNLLSHIVEMNLMDDEILLLTSPLPHSAGFFLQAGLLKGAYHFLESKFDPEVVLHHISENRITCTFMVPTMIYRLLDRCSARDIDTSSLRTILYGAAPITPERLQQGLAQFGMVFMQFYGQSEAPNFISRLRREDHRLDSGNAQRLGSCGQAATMASIRIVDNDGVELRPGDVGEIIVKTPYNMNGYRGLAEESASALRSGWLHTGDLGYFDKHGYLYLLDRKKDIIITGGMNVYSSEVEAVIAAHRDVSQVAVIGVPHPDWGEAVVAFIVPADGYSIDTNSLLSDCRKELAKYKQPKAIHILDSIPTTVYGKLDKKILRELWPGWD
ncbi:AMP-binding protein [Nocardia sp. NPDC004168]|uniref:AMP-binding protein n=1 Tax=Nocardia sp. NPDC004168 TaxID=3154452 RepID=UPI0033AA0726